MNPGEAILSAIGGSNREERVASVLDALTREGWAFVNMKGEAGAGPVGEAVATSRSELQEVCDLLAERKYGSPARSPAHNARLVIERILARLLDGAGEVERDEAHLAHADAYQQTAMKNLARAATAEAALAESEQNAQGLASDLAGTEAELAETRERLEKVKAALRWYEEHARIGGDSARFAIFRDDHGAKARAALSTQESSAALAGDWKEGGR